MLFGKPETLSIGVVGIAALAGSITAGDSASPGASHLIQEPRQEANSRKAPKYYVHYKAKRGWSHRWDGSRPCVFERARSKYFFEAFCFIGTDTV